MCFVIQRFSDLQNIHILTTTILVAKVSLFIWPQFLLMHVF